MPLSNAFPQQRQSLLRNFCLTSLVCLSGAVCLFAITQKTVRAAELSELVLAPTPQVTPPSEGSSPFINNYILGAGDMVRVEIFRIPDYSGEYEVMINGTLNLAMVGQVSVAGLTLEQAAQAISQAYSSRLRLPIVNLFLTEPRPLRIGIAGEVSRPGEYVLEREGTQFPSLVSALETAGGITQSADLRRIVVQRIAPSGESQRVIADLWQFLNTGDLRYSLVLRDGDTVYIPTRDSFDNNESLQLATANFAADASRPLNIAVDGEVFRPGPHIVTGQVGNSPGNSTEEGAATGLPRVSQAIQEAGGIQSEANIREIQVYRRTRGGAEQVIDVNLWRLLTSGDITEDIALQEGDTIVIPKAETVPNSEISELAAASFSPDSITINVVGEVSSPGRVEVAPNTPISQGVLAAGGFNRRAHASTVDLIRLNANGSATRSTIEIDFAEGIDESANPLLRNNDIILVRRSGTASFSDTIDSIVNPLGRAFSLFSIPTSIFNLFN